MFISKPLHKIIQDNPPIDTVVKIIKQQEDDINSVLQRLNFSLEILESSLKSIKESYAILEELGGITIQAKNIIKSDKNVDITDVTKRYNIALKKLDTNSKKAICNGINLLMGGSLTTVFDNKETQKITINGLIITAKNLEFRAPDFTSEINIRNSRIDVMNAMDVVVALRYMIQDDIFTITTSKEFAEMAIIAANNGRIYISSPLTITESQSLLILNQRELPFALAEDAQVTVLNNFAQSKPNKE